MVSAVESSGAGIKGMDQLSTVTTRTQLQRIHLRSLSPRGVLSPPPPQVHKHTENTTITISMCVRCKTFQTCSFGIADPINEGANFPLITRMNILICSCTSIKVAHWFISLTHFQRKEQKQRKRRQLCWSTLETKLMKPAQVKTVTCDKKQKHISDSGLHQEYINMPKQNKAHIYGLLTKSRPTPALWNGLISKANK